MTRDAAVMRRRRLERSGPGDSPHNIRRPGLRPRVLLLALLACACVLVLGPGSAQALLVHTGEFGSAGGGAGQFSTPTGVTVDQSSGDVYVIDSGNSRIEKFGSSGNFILAFGKGVDQTTGGDICTATSGDTCQAATTGSAAGEFTTPQFLAVDNSGGASAGDVYVGDPGDGIISKFTSGGALVTSWGTGGQLSGGFTSIDGITVDKNGQLLVIDDNNSVWEFGQDGSSAGQPFSTTRGMSRNGMDVDSSGNIFKVNGDTSVEKVTSTGADVGQVNSGGTEALVIDRSSGDLYVSTGSAVQHYQFDNSGNVIEPGNTTCTPANSSPCNPTDTFGSNVLSGATGIGFDSSQTLLYVANGNNKVEIFGPPSPGQPEIDSETPSPGSTYATVSAQIIPFGNDTTCQFQYVDDTDFQATGYTSATTVACSPADLGSTFEDQTATADISGLSIKTEYHFRVVAKNSAGTTTGDDSTFTTQDAAAIDQESPSNIGSTYAELDTQVNPLGTDTTCEFQYVDDTDFQATGYTSATTVDCPSDLGAGKNDVSASVQISGLTINTTYHFHVIASNSLGTVTGTDMMFETMDAAAIDGQSFSNITQTSAELDAQVNPLGTDTTCEFQYVDDTDFLANGYTSATTVACTPADLGNGKSDVSASTQLSNLQPGTTYHFHVVASNGLGTVTGSDQMFQTLPAESIDAESASNITDTTARLGAQINPEGQDTKAQFEYVNDASFQATGFTTATTVPANKIDLGSGTSDVAASVDLTGLTPATTYHFRVMAANSIGSATGDAHSFKTYQQNLPKGLPDHRGLEMVTPPDKDNGEPFVRGGVFGQVEAANNGNAIAFISFNAFPGSVFDGSFYRAARGSSAWTTHNLIPPQSTEAGLLCATAGPVIAAFSPDLSKAILSDGNSLIGTCGTDSPPLVSGEPTGVANLFVRNNATNTFQLVDVTPNGVTPQNATFDGGSTDLSHVVFDENAALTGNAPAGDNLYEWTGGAVRLVTVVGGNGVSGTLADGPAGYAFHAVSADGSRIFFNANGNLYLRQNGTSTTQVDASKAAGPGGGGSFVGASTDGSKVFFTDDASAGLTNDTVPSSGANLYEYDVPSGTLTDLTPASQANVDGVSGLSDDGSFVYFVAEGNLASGATAGQPNLYVNHNGTTTFIANLSGGDSSDWSETSDTTRVSTNGHFIAFNSNSNLTSFDSSGNTEIFEYNAVAKQLSCASCNPDGTAPSTGIGIPQPETPLLGNGSEYVTHNVSDSGQVFFNTAESLLPTDNNGKQDVYEYGGGALHLITTAASPDDSLFLDASTDGSNVFFTTSQQLLPQDTDGAMDIYDARVNGGFPVTAPPPVCSGEGCKPPQSPVPPVPTVASVTFFGPGNVKKVHVVKHGRLKGDTIRLRVKVPARGRISIAGRRVMTARRTVRHAGTYRMSVHLKGHAAGLLRQRRKLGLVLTVRYVRAGARPSTATIHLTLDA
jgi:hypothetical protein